MFLCGVVFSCVFMLVLHLTCGVTSSCVFSASVASSCVFSVDGLLDRLCRQVCQ